jgi:ABC-type polysaccharide/polyol phosphate export permease
VYATTSLFVRINLHWTAAALAPLGLLILGSAGIAMIIAGITLVWKRIQILNDLVLMLMFFFSGAVLRLDEMPDWAVMVGKPIFMTHSTEAIRIVMVDGNPIPWTGTGGWLWTLGTALAWFAVGFGLFQITERVAKRQGGLSRF